jgi:hypothetical protein
MMRTPGAGRQARIAGSLSLPCQQRFLVMWPPSSLPFGIVAKMIVLPPEVRQIVGLPGHMGHRQQPGDGETWIGVRSERWANSSEL